MNLFYLLSLLVLTAGIIVGYKTGFIRIVIILFITAAAIACSCYFFHPVFQLLKNEFSFDEQETSLIAFTGVTFIVLLVLFLVIRKFLFSKTTSKRHFANRFSGALTGLVISAGALVIFITLSGIVEMPAGFKNELYNSGITSLITDTEKKIWEQPINEEPKQQGLKILSADNTAYETNAFYRLSFATTDYIPEPELEKKMLQLINIERSKQHLKLLVADSALCMVARKHDADMLARSYFSHNSPEGKTPFDRLHDAKITYRYAGENLAFSSSLIKAHQELMLSPGHKANILNKQYHKAGIGILRSPEYGLMITQEFKD